MDILVLILFVIGFGVLIKGADLLVDGAKVLAKSFGISDLIVGLTVVAFGTSLPELIVNLFAGAESSELALGNIVGSNIANTLLILGVAAMLKPLVVHRKTVYREIVFNIGAAVMLGVLVSERLLSEGGFRGLDHIDGIVLISYFVLFLYYTFGKVSLGKKPKDLADSGDATSVNFGKIFLQIFAGAAGLWLGGQWIVNGAVEIAGFFGVSDALIGLTVVAIGTSLPELVASVIAVKKGSVDIAVGNAVGSNLFNIFWVLGLSAIINPIGFQDGLLIDIAINIGVALLLFGTMVFGRGVHTISKFEGRLFVLLYVCYMIFVVARG